MFQAIYDSAWHHPGICWGAAVLSLFLLWAQRSNRRGVLTHGGARLVWPAMVVFQLAIMTDALFTGGLTPVNSKSGLSAGLSVLFVVLGDLRFFILFEQQQKRPSDHHGWWRAIAWSLLIPVASLPARWLWPGNSRALFLTYELMFAALSASWLWLRVPKIEDERQRAWLKRLTLFELVQYASWSTADILILSGVEVGILFRLVPNTLYYAAFVPFAWLTSPARNTPPTDVVTA